MAGTRTKLKSSTAVNAPENSDEIAQLRTRLAAAEAEKEDLRGRLSESESGRQASERRVISEAEKRLQAQEDAAATNVEAIGGELDSLEAQIANLSEEPGHGKEIAALNRKMADAAARLREEENRKKYFAGMRERAATEAQQRNADTRTAAPANTGGLKLADGRPLSGFTPKAQAWMRQHPELFDDIAACRRMNACADYVQQMDGIDPVTQFDAYAAEVEKRYSGQVQEDDPDDGEEFFEEQRPSAASPYSRPAPARTQQQRQPEQRTQRQPGEQDLEYEVEAPQHRAAGPGSMTLPASRRSPNGPGAQRRQPNLTTEQREVADDLYPDMPQADRYRHYAANRTLMEARYPGKFN